MAYTVRISNRFKKDFKRCMKRGLDMKLITDAMDLLEATGTLPAEYKPHQLKGDHKGQWECHIEPNWLMTWEQTTMNLRSFSSRQALMQTSSAGNIFLLPSNILTTFIRHPGN